MKQARSEAEQPEVDRVVVVPNDIEAQFGSGSRSMAVNFNESTHQARLDYVLHSSIVARSTRGLAAAAVKVKRAPWRALGNSAHAELARCC